LNILRRRGGQIFKTMNGLVAVFFTYVGFIVNISLSLFLYGGGITVD